MFFCFFNQFFLFFSFLLISLFCLFSLFSILFCLFSFFSFFSFLVFFLISFFPFFLFSKHHKDEGDVPTNKESWGNPTNKWTGGGRPRLPRERVERHPARRGGRGGGGGQGTPFNNQSGTGERGETATKKGEGRLPNQEGAREKPQPTRARGTTNQQGRGRGRRCPGEGTPFEPPNGEGERGGGRGGNPTKMSAQPRKFNKFNPGGVGRDKICKVKSWRGTY